MIGLLRNIKRLCGIIYILIREDILFIIPKQWVILHYIGKIFYRRRAGSKGARLSSALQRLGPIAVKFGQALSTRSDIFSANIISELTLLQDKLPPSDKAYLEHVIQKEFGLTVHDMFADIDYNAVGAGSLATVYRATTHEGDDIALKILRPNIITLFERDIALLRFLAAIAEKFSKEARRLRFNDVVNTFATWTRQELDLRLEAAAAEELAANFVDEELFHVPDIYWDYTTKNILCTEWIDGFRLDDDEAFARHKLQKSDILATASRIFFLQLFRDGYFHADLHPGNLFITSNGTICPIDFGIMGVITHKHKIFLADILIGFLEHDYHKVADAHFIHHIVPPNHSKTLFALTIHAIGEPLLNKSLGQISIGTLLQELFYVTRQFDMQTQPDLLLMQKNVLMAESLGRMLDDHSNIWILSAPLIEKWIRNNRGLEARVKDQLHDLQHNIQRLPILLDKLEKFLDTNPTKKT